MPRHWPNALPIRAFAVALLALPPFAACDTLPNDDARDLCADSPPHPDCERCRAVPRAADCPQCTDDPADPDCETASGMGGTPPLSLVDAATSIEAGIDGSAMLCSGTSCSGAPDASPDAAPTCEGEGGDPGCPLARPICDLTTTACVECLTSPDCSDTEPHCDPATHSCVECTAHSHCTPAKCSPDHACVDCLAPADCLDTTAARCDDTTHTCEPCGDNADCAHFEGYDICDAGECVECTGTEYAACGEDSGTPLVCNSPTRTCSDKKERSAAECSPCISDAQCIAGQLCVMEMFGTPAIEVGYFCAWDKAAAGGGAPAGDCFNVPPFVDTVSDSVSIDGTAANACGLRLSTCPAYTDFSSKNCESASSPGTGDDSLCGFNHPNTQDAYCVQPGPSTFLCTTPCISASDCKGVVACDMVSSPDVCEL